jgi:hypothetical protein
MQIQSAVPHFTGVKRFEAQDEKAAGKYAKDKNGTLVQLNGEPPAFLVFTQDADSCSISDALVAQTLVDKHKAALKGIEEQYGDLNHVDAQPALHLEQAGHDLAILKLAAEADAKQNAFVKAH